MLEKIKKFLFIELDQDVQREVDYESLSNIYRLSFAVVIFECIAMALFLLTRKEFDHDAWVSIGSVGFCILICVCGFIFSWLMMKRADLAHKQVLIFMIFYYVIIVAWAIFVSHKDYVRHQQLITFAAVELMMVCFIPFNVIISTIVTLLTYGVLLSMLFAVDGALGINLFNYFVMMLVSAAGMIVRYKSVVAVSEKTVQLEHSNGLLEHANRHDALTGLLNRKAFREDVPKLLNKHVKAFMLDINYFKEVNDTYGHAIGDEILKETARHLKNTFPKGQCYRYGGDEFLIISFEDETYDKDTYTFPFPGVPDKEVLLSIGSAEADISAFEQLDVLFAAADESLYRVKKRTHSVEYGGHDRRRR